MAHRHASTAVGPTLASHASPAIDAGPGPSSTAIPERLRSSPLTYSSTVSRSFVAALGPPAPRASILTASTPPAAEPDYPNATCGGRVVRVGCPPACDSDPT